MRAIVDQMVRYMRRDADVALPWSVFLRPYSEVSWDDQLTRESLVERALRAGVHAKRTLLAGFTTVRYAEPCPPTPGAGCEHPADINERRAGSHFWNRDLGTEGAADADIALRKCLSGPDPLIPGPRYFCANRAIVSTGSYGASVDPNADPARGLMHIGCCLVGLSCRAEKQPVCQSRGDRWRHGRGGCRWGRRVCQSRPQAGRRGRRLDQGRSAISFFVHRWGILKSLLAWMLRYMRVRRS